MKVKWLGHASFLVSDKLGKKIITDPYAVVQGINHGEIKEVADVITVSHSHYDHSNTALPGQPSIVSGKEVIALGGQKLVKGIEFLAFASYHDPNQGRQRGENAIFCFTLDGVKICHLGDLGHLLSDDQIAKISTDLAPVHVLLTPVGGTYSLNAAEAWVLAQKMKPNIVIPMHFKNPKVHFPMATVDDFLKGKEGVKRLGTSEVELDLAQLPIPTEIWVLNPAL